MWGPPSRRAPASGCGRVAEVCICDRVRAGHPDWLMTHVRCQDALQCMGGCA